MFAGFESKQAVVLSNGGLRQIYQDVDTQKIVVWTELGSIVGSGLFIVFFFYTIRKIKDISRTRQVRFTCLV